jgi:hypothetical protein
MQSDSVHVRCVCAFRGWCGVNRGMRLTPQLQQQLPDREQLCVGLGRVTAGRRELFKQQQGLAIEMVERVFDVTPCNGEPLERELCINHVGICIWALCRHVDATAGRVSSYLAINSDAAIAVWGPHSDAARRMRLDCCQNAPASSHPVWSPVRTSAYLCLT